MDQRSGPGDNKARAGRALRGEGDVSHALQQVEPTCLDSGALLRRFTSELIACYMPSLLGNLVAEVGLEPTTSGL